MLARDRSGMTIGQHLARTRLEHRAQRIQTVLSELHRVAEYRAAGGPVPAALRHAIDDFHSELAAIRKALATGGGE
jgi:hypothetical protein